MISTVYNMDGLDHIGSVYLGQAAEMARDLDLFGPSSNIVRTDMDVACQFTAWRLFVWQA